MITVKMFKIVLKPLFLLIMKISPFQINHFSQKRRWPAINHESVGVGSNNIFLNGIRENQMI